jgi:hypothetical protein
MADSRGEAEVEAHPLFIGILSRQLNVGRPARLPTDHDGPMSPARTVLVRVIGLTPAGKQQLLDEAAAGAAIPASSLAVTGRTVTWTNNGAAKSAAL